MRESVSKRVLVANPILDDDEGGLVCGTGFEERRDRIRFDGLVGADDVVELLV